ncbi:hypothetical protein PENSPDRAFT_651489 [Peniophora sp. CONT]|nr:hypothetical protein PENSPDRAFT_651489 [Peniophora sp. CONT]
MAPFLERVLISKSSPYTPQWWHEEIARALGSAEDMRFKMKTRKVEVKYDSVMAPLIGNVSPEELDDAMKEERRCMATLVRGDWEELAHSFVAGVLGGYDFSRLEGEGDSQALLE